MTAFQSESHLPSTKWKTNQAGSNTLISFTAKYAKIKDFFEISLSVSLFPKEENNDTLQKPIS